MSKEYYCSFCEKTRGEVATLISSSTEGTMILICNQCVSNKKPTKKRKDRTCSFCNKIVKKCIDAREPIGATICSDCLRICVEILSDD